MKIIAQQTGGFFKMNKKGILIAIATVFVLGMGFILYEQTNPSEYVPADDEIALHIQLDTEDDVGLLVFDYRADGHEYSGGMANADKSLIKHDSNNIQVWNKQQLNSSSDTVELSIQLRIITEYVDPNYENIYPEDITRYMDPISWEAHFGESYIITITGDKAGGYKAVLNYKFSQEKVLGGAVLRSPAQTGRFSIVQTENMW